MFIDQQFGVAMTALTDADTPGLTLAIYLFSLSLS